MTVTAIVRGNQLIRHTVENDDVVLRYTNPQLDDGTPLEAGTISIQSESHPTQFRSIELKPIDPDAPIGTDAPGSDGATGPLWSGYTKTELASSLERPMAIEVAPDRRVFFTTRGPPVDEEDDQNATARVGVIDPDSGEISTALELEVNIVQENGLQGIALDPDFEENGWVYVYYTLPTTATSDADVKHLSRFTMEDGTIDPDSEAVLLEVPTPPDQWSAHVGGDIEFDSQGNLYLSVGDDTSPFESSGYTPIDERDGRELYDAQRTTADTADLRGKILRITPQDDGSYTIPEGNMFTRAKCADEIEEGRVRPEIYLMGQRNPFRMGIDPKTDTLYWGDYGPDAGQWDPQRGPPGIVEFNRADESGYYGWPYVVGPNIPYVDGEFVDADNDQDYTFESSGEPFDPQNLANTSSNNDGLTRLPSPKQPAIWYPYSWDELLDSPPEYAQEYLPEEPPFPEFEGGAPMGGPISRYEESFGKKALPEYFDGRHFIAEWGTDWIRTVSYDENGEVQDIQPFMPDETFLSPMDMTIGPDGALYLLEWGVGYATEGTEQSGIYRIERMPAVSFNDPDDERVVSPNTTVTVDATITNPYDSAVKNGEITLSAPEDSNIEISAVEGTTFDSLGPTASQTISWEVTTPSSAGGQHTLTATATYTSDGEEMQTSSTMTLIVGRNLAGEWLFHEGDDSSWKQSGLDTSNWQTVEAPAHWEDHSDYTNDPAYGWYRKTITVPESWEGQDVQLRLGRFDDVDETFFDGTKIGQTGTFPESDEGYQTAWDEPRQYTVSSENINYGGENVIAIRGYDDSGPGGLYEGPLLVIPQSSE